MLGFDYLGQTALGALAYSQIVLRVTESLYVKDTVKAYARHILSIVESCTIADRFSYQLAAILRVIEKATISDNTKLYFMIVALEAVILAEKVTTAFGLTIKEIIRVSDYVKQVAQMFVHEIATIADRFKTFITLAAIKEKVSVKVKEFFTTGIFVHEIAAIGDSLSTSFMILAREIVRLTDKTRYLVPIVIKESVTLVENLVELLVKIIASETMYVKEKVTNIITLVVQEIVKLSGRLIVNGKELLEFWAACYKKGVAQVANLYRKFRR